MPPNWYPETEVGVLTGVNYEQERKSSAEQSYYSVYSDIFRVRAGVMRLQGARTYDLSFREPSDSHEWLGKPELRAERTCRHSGKKSGKLKRCGTHHARHVDAVMKLEREVLGLFRARQKRGHEKSMARLSGKRLSQKSTELLRRVSMITESVRDGA
jgi:hypothetical protein